MPGQTTPRAFVTRGLAAAGGGLLLGFLMLCLLNWLPDLRSSGGLLWSLDLALVFAGLYWASLELCRDRKGPARWLLPLVVAVGLWGAYLMAFFFILAMLDALVFGACW